jgi:hypothetical protein
MKRKALSLSVIAMIVSLMITFSCKKEKETETNDPPVSVVKVATENASIEAAFADAYRQADKACRENNIKDINSCPVVTITPFNLTYPKDVVIDYGTSCTGDDGAVRSGKILLHLTQNYVDSGSVVTVTFDNYYINNRKITGTETITNHGINNAGHHVFNVVIQNGNLFSLDGVTTYNSVQQREWIEGDNTWLNPIDDVYMITGTGNGITTEGTSYTVTITSPLRASINCAWIQSGIIDITSQNYPVISINYGTGDCDNMAVATCSGYSTNIVMP